MNTPKRLSIEVIDCEDPSTFPDEQDRATQELLLELRARALEIAPFDLIDLDLLIEDFERNGDIMVLDRVHDFLCPLQQVEDKDLRKQYRSQIKREFVRQIQSADSRELMSLFDDLFEIHVELGADEPHDVRFISCQEVIRETPHTNN